MLKRIEIENAFKNSAKDGGAFGFKEEVVPLSICLDIVKEYFSEETDDKDIEIAKLEAKLNVYESVISKLDYNTIKGENKE